MSWKDCFPQENRYFETSNGILYCGDALGILKQLPDISIDCVVTSPPYWALRDYDVEGQIGLEATFQEYLEKLWQIFDEVYRILKPTGTVWVNLGDTYGQNWRGSDIVSASRKQFSNKGTVDFMGRKPPKRNEIPKKSLFLIPSRFAIGMIERGWILRNEIIWHKPNAMPQSVKDRFTVDYEKIFFFVKRGKYYFEQQLEPYDKPLNRWGGAKFKAKRESQWGKRTGQSIYRDRNRSPNPNGRNKRCVWSINTKPFKDAHFAVFPPELPQTCIKAGCPPNGIVADIFMGSGTTAVVAEELGRRWIGIELNPKYCEMAKRRIKGSMPLFTIYGGVK